MQSQSRSPSMNINFKSIRSRVGSVVRRNSSSPSRPATLSRLGSNKELGRPASPSPATRLSEPVLASPLAASTETQTATDTADNQEQTSKPAEPAALTSEPEQLSNGVPEATPVDALKEVLDGSVVAEPENIVVKDPATPSVEPTVTAGVPEALPVDPVNDFVNGVAPEVTTSEPQGILLQDTGVPSTEPTTAATGDTPAAAADVVDESMVPSADDDIIPVVSTPSPVGTTHTILPEETIPDPVLSPFEPDVAETERTEPNVEPASSIQGSDPMIETTVWLVDPVPVDEAEAPNTIVDNEDPFADPEPLSESVELVAVIESAAEPDREIVPDDPLTDDETPFNPLMVPLPELHEVITRPALETPVFEASSAPLRPAIAPSDYRELSFRPAPSAETLGWNTHALPGLTYFTHPELRVTTDIDIRDPRKLEIVMAYIERELLGSEAFLQAPLNGSEVRIRGEEKGRGKDGKLVCEWVDHVARILSSGPVVDESEYSRLLMQSRYWGFLESHPAHALLPAGAHKEALDTLTWCYSDCLLHSDNPAPFTQDECHELIPFLRSLPGPGFMSEVERIVHTRVVSRVMARIVQSRREAIRSLESTAAASGSHHQNVVAHLPVIGPALRYMLSWLYLVIPYLFIDRYRISVGFTSVRFDTDRWIRMKESGEFTRDQAEREESGSGRGRRSVEFAS